MTFRAPNRRAVTPQDRGRFGDYDVLDEVPRWDDVTAGVVLARLGPTTDLAFFTTHEDGIANPLCDLLLAQDCDPRIPVVAMVDARLAVGESDGWHYDDMPPDPQAWRDTLRFLDEDAQDAHGCGFAQLRPQQQAAVVQAVQDASGSGSWHGLPAKQVWSLWTRYTTTAFYSHPWAWNEIGFGGPAYPRGYKNIGVDSREPWERRDQSDSDPGAFAQRVEQAHQARHHLVRGEEHS